MYWFIMQSSEICFSVDTFLFASVILPSPNVYCYDNSVDADKPAVWIHNVSQQFFE